MKKNIFNRLIFTTVFFTVLEAPVFAQNWSVYDVTNPSGSFINIDPNGGMFGIQVRLTGTQYPDSLVVHSATSQYEGFPALCRINRTGNSGPQPSGMGSTLCAYWFTVEIDINRTEYNVGNLNLDLIGYHNGTPANTHVQLTYSIRQTSTKIDPGVIGPNQNHTVGDTAQKLHGTPATDFSGGTPTYSWQKNEGTGWITIDGQTADHLYPGVINKTTHYKRIAANRYQTTESNIVIIKVEDPQSEPESEPGRPLVDTTRNYIIKRITRTGLTALRQDSLSNNLTTITYYDGLGRPDQIVDVGASADGKDQVLPIVYDAFDRDDAVSYLPYVSSMPPGSYKDSWEAELTAFYDDLFRTEPQESALPRTDILYDSPATDLIRSRRGPGREFRTDNRAQFVTHRTNTDSEVRLFDLLNGRLRFAGYYPGGKLYRIRTEDEDHRIAEEFRNHANEPVLRRVYLSDTTHVDTYYVYDQRDRLIRVLPPLAIEKMTAQPGELLSSDFVDKYLYCYSYTNRGLIASRRIPGCAGELYEYDCFDQMIFKTRTHDEGTENFLYTYDNLGRLIVEWVTTTRPNPSPNGPDIVSVSDTMAVYRYDTYPALSWGGFVAADSVVTSYDNRVFGYKTYEKIRIVEFGRDDVWTYDRSSAPHVERLFYYDRMGRPVQTVERMSDGTQVRYSTRYDWRGNVIATVEEHLSSDNSNDCIMVTTACRYDHADRPTESRISVNGQECAVIRKEYDKLSRLAKRSFRHNDFTFTDTMTYNIRGWTTRLSSDYFDQRLRYTDPLFGQPQYTGNISEIEWSHEKGTPHTYRFDYDSLSRLTNSLHYIGQQPTDMFTERELRYDGLGNLLHLRRRGMADEIWTLDYRYDGSRLMSVEAETPAGDNPTYRFDYDIFGNRTKDGCNNLRLQYNYLNLLQEVTDTVGSLHASYRHEWNGRKVGVRDPRPGWSRDYTGSLVYVVIGGERHLESIEFEGGRILSTSEGLQTRFFIRDHLGSVRVVLNDDGNVVERNDYYPFGLRWNNHIYPVTDNRYRFNGKEEQLIGTMPYIDYGARMYDPYLGCWFSKDPKADKYSDCSTYDFCTKDLQ